MIDELSGGILAIDYGGQRVGIAVSQGILPRALVVLPHGRPETLIERVLDLARQEGIQRLLVGFPLNSDGSVGPQAEKSIAFARSLAGATELPVYLWDERRSSQIARDTMIARGTSRKARRRQLDAHAAAAFLQDYLDQRGEGAILVVPAEPSAPTEVSDE